jgi:hypothetical protein
MRQATAAGFCLLLCLPAAAPFSSARAETYFWVQHAPAGIEARAVTDGPACPQARIDGAARSMKLRAAPGRRFPVRVCSLPLPAGAASADIGGVPLALPANELRRIAVIGDTGCRLKEEHVQACNDPRQWPFALIAQVVAQTKPDLVIHVGDYHYRETPCPSGNLGCAGSPFGDTWAVWRADFFAPADTLLKTAPWVFVRGNHETCARGGHGWSRALEPFAFDAARGCNKPARPFAVRLPGLMLAVFDVSSAREETVDEAEAKAFRVQYQTLAEWATKPTWLLQHRPIWSAPALFGGQPVGYNRTLAVAADGLIPAQVTMMLSGHHHMFQVLEYQSDLPPQVVSGNGGDTLNKGPNDNPAGWVMAGVTVKSGLNMLGTFGYSMLEKQDDGGWRLTAYDRLGTVLRSCLIKDRTASCPPS